MSQPHNPIVKERDIGLGAYRYNFKKERKGSMKNGNKSMQTYVLGPIRKSSVKLPSVSKKNSHHSVSMQQY